MKSLKLILIVLIAGAVSLTLEAKKVDLKYILEKGTEISFEITTIQEIGQEIMGQVQETNTELTQIIQFLVEDVTPEGNFLIAKTVVNYKIVSGSGMGSMEFNSETLDDNPIMESLKWITDESINFVMSPKGEILEVFEIETKIDRVKEMIDNPGPEFQLIASMVTQFASEDGIKNSISTILLSYPVEKVKKGKPWQSTSSLQQIIDFKSLSSTQINEINGDVVILTQDVKIEAGEDGNTIEMEGMEMEYELAGEKQASFEIDLKTGLTEKSEGVITISGVISIDSPQLPAPMSIPMTIKITETVKRVE